jgi:lantibiotic biosynthesis protein
MTTTPRADGPGIDRRGMTFAPCGRGHGVSVGRFGLPTYSPKFAHGAAGLLALLAPATIHGCTVDGQHEAITTLIGWFDQWQQDSPAGSWWPQWLTRSDLRTGRLTQQEPGRPSWCYGSVGIARAQQLAAIATNNPRRQEVAEDALAASLTNTQLDRITDPGLCHGIAGIYQTAYRAARDARNSAIGRRLPELAARLTHADSFSDKHAAGLLTGHTGVALALETHRHPIPPHTGWDTCLLIT